MPARGKRVASRQAQLNRRRRKQARSASEASVQAVATEEMATASVSQPSQPVTPATEGNGSAAPTPAPIRVRPTQPAQDPQNLGRAGQALAYTHLPSELRRILTLAGILTVVLIALSFVF